METNSVQDDAQSWDQGLEGFSIDLGGSVGQKQDYGETYGDYPPENTSVYRKDTGGVASSLMMPHKAPGAPSSIQTETRSNYSSSPSLETNRLEFQDIPEEKSIMGQKIDLPLGFKIDLHPTPDYETNILEENHDPFLSLIDTLNVQHDLSLENRNQFVGVFFYEGKHQNQPPDINASVQAMQSEDGMNWIVFKDDTNEGKRSLCEKPLSDYDESKTPFCHKSFTAKNILEAMDMARSIALKSSSHATAFVVQYNNGLDDQIEANITGSFILSQNNGGHSSEDSNESSDGPTAGKKSIFWTIGVLILALIVFIISFFVVKKNKKIDVKEKKVSQTVEKEYVAPETPLAGTFF